MITMKSCLLILLGTIAFASPNENHTSNCDGDAQLASAFCSQDWEPTQVTISVSQNNGNDSLSCIFGEGECKTLQFAYKEAIERFSNTTQQILIRITDEVYTMSEPLVIDRPSASLRYLEISSTLPNTTLLSINPNAMVMIGCNNTYGIPCIQYSVYFKNLKFRNFQSLYPSVLILFTATKVGVLDCEFISNNCSAINSLDTPVEIIRTNFKENHGNGDFKQSLIGSSLGFPMSNLSNGGATAFIFQHVSNITVKVQNCLFHNNSVSIKYQLPFIDHSGNDTVFPRVGGGILLLFMLKTAYNNIYLSDNNFTKNHAYSAGGVGVIAESEASFNTVYLDGCTFDGNRVFSTSGGILFAVWDQCVGNRMVLDNCHFYNNFAKFAGGIKLLLHSPSNKQKTSEVSILEIRRSIFCSNHADTGSAMHLVYDFLYQQNYKTAVVVNNCTFCQHKVLFNQNKLGRNGSLLYGGTILTHRIDIEFRGNNYVISNNGGCGLYASNANININGFVLFSGNRATSPGGGMSLADISRIVFYKGSHLRFEDNYSDEKGGALAVFTIGMPELTYVHNPFCFLQYYKQSLPYSKWDMKLEFIRNGAAMKAGAVFINTLTSCLWNEGPKHYSFHEALRWNDNFVYVDNYVDAMFNIITEVASNKTSAVDIATDTSKLVLTGPKEVTLSPGEEVKFGLVALDELGNEIHSVAMAESIARFPNGTTVGSTLLFPNIYFVLTPFTHREDHSFSFIISDRNYHKAFTDKSVNHEVLFSDRYSSFIASVTMKIKPILCHPGFYFDKSKKSCVCDTKRDLVKKCIGTTVLIQEGYWVTNDSDGNLITLYCPNGYCKCNRPSDNINGCIYDYKSPDKQCQDGRNGKLCGSCNKSLGLSLHTGGCVACDQQSKTIVILVIVVVFVVLIAVMVVYLNPNFSTKLRGPAFFTQIIPYVFINEHSLFFNVARGIASFTALGGPAGLPFDGCLSESMDKLDVNALTYLFAAAILLVLLAVYVLDRFYVLHFTRDSPFEAFWILLVGIYVFFTEASLIFYYCVPIGNNEVVFFYDGSLQCYHGRHLIMILASSAVLLFFVLLPPLMVIFMCFGIITVPLQVIDALTKGLREPVRWWWAIDLIRRFWFVAIYVFVPYEGVKRVAFIILSTFFLALHAHCQPYVSKFSNISETILLFSISILATLQANDSGASSMVSSVVFMLTFLYICCLFLYLLVQFVRRRLKKIRNSKFQELENEQNDVKRKQTRTPERVNNVSI